MEQHNTKIHVEPTLFSYSNSNLHPGTFPHSSVVTHCSNIFTQQEHAVTLLSRCLLHSTLSGDDDASWKRNEPENGGKLVTKKIIQ